MSANPDFDRELAAIRADPRYGVEGADEDLLMRELDLLIQRTFEIEAQRALERRKRRRAPPAAPAKSTPAAPIRPSPVAVLPVATGAGPVVPLRTTPSAG